MSETLSPLIRFEKDEKSEKGPRRFFGPPELAGSKPNYMDVMLKHVAGRVVSYDEFFDLFQEVEFFSTNLSYDAIEFVFAFLQEVPEIKKTVFGAHEFLYRSDQKVGLLMNFIIYKQTGPNSVSYDHDVRNRVTCFSLVKASISAFFSKNPGAILAVDVATERHDSILFMRKMGRGYDYVHFSPNFEHRILIVEHIIENMSKDRRVRGYNAEDGDDEWNTRHSCSAHSWQQVYRFMRLGFNPFNRDVLYEWNKRYKFWIYPREILKFEPEKRLKRVRAKLRYPSEYNPADRKLKKKYNAAPAVDQQPIKRKRKRDI